MQYNKNDKISLDIIDMTKEGLGLAKSASQVFFVKDALVGDKVNAIITKVTAGIIYAKTIEIIKASEFRVEEKCKVSNKCGGCQLLNLDYNKQLDIKKNNFLNTMKKIAKVNLTSNGSTCYDGLLGSASPYNYRNKMQIPFTKRNDEIIYGFYAGRTHYVIPIDECVVGFKGVKEILDLVKTALVKCDISIYNEETNQGIFREVMLRKGNTSNEISITYILNDKNYKSNIEVYNDFDEYIRSNTKLNIITSTLNINTNANNVLFGNINIVIYGEGYITDSIGDVKFHISPESFYQVNMEMTKKMYDKILEYADFKGDENVLDLYCGIGTISLYISKYVKKVTGVEIVQKAIENAIENAKINGINNANFVCFDASNIGNITKDEFDAIIVDPPRKGLDLKTINYIINIGPKKLIYVSCDPATLARDIDLICKSNNYIIKRVINVDMFPHTMHVETIALIEKIC